MRDCANCHEPDADFDCNGLKFCNEICGFNYLEPELEIVNVKMAKTLSDKIPNGTKGYVVGAGDGLNQVHFENGTIAFCFMNELDVSNEPPVVFSAENLLNYINVKNQFEIDRLREAHGSIGIGLAVQKKLVSLISNGEIENKCDLPDEYRQLLSPLLKH